MALQGLVPVQEIRIFMARRSPAAQLLHQGGEVMEQGTRAAAPILVVEAGSPSRQLFATLTEGEGYEAAWVSCVAEAREAGRRRQFALVVCDLKLPDGDGLEVQRYFQETQPGAGFILLTEMGTMASAMEALRRGALDYLEKPLRHPRELKRAIQRAIVLAARTADSAARVDAPRATPGLCGSMVARDPRMLHVLDLLGKVAPVDVHVTLIGETGVGKEVIARCIHQHSRRAGRPFIAAHCASLSPALVEIELFGHEPGAFAGATGPRPGALERARGGTVFLDGVSELPPSVQLRLLQALREGRFRRSGGDELLETDFRIISATDRDLETGASERSLNPELLARLGAFPIEIPPLRDRPADIDALAEQFLAAAAAKFGKPQLRLSDSARFVLRSHAWPGNVRELENAIERAAILSDGEILPGHLPFGAVQPLDPAAAGTLNVHELERKAIEEALRLHGGNRTRAARELGISLRTLQYRLKEFGLTRA